VAHPLGWEPYTLMTRLRHLNEIHSVRFITFATHKRIPLFADPVLADNVLDALNILPAEFHISILAFVIMPDHVHLVVFPPDGTDVGRAVGRFKALSALSLTKYLKDLNPSLLPQLEVERNGVRKYAIWTRRCYDHNCRSKQAVIEKITYCHNNPVVRKLAARVEEYRWSSAGWYAGERNLPFEIDSVKL
jgi:putative transposase